MAEAIEQARKNVQAAFERTVALADSAGPRTLFSFEQELWSLMLALGRALVGLFLLRQACRLRAVQYEHEGQRWQLEAERTSKIGTRFGKVPFTRRVGKRLGLQRGACDFPVDRDLGLCGGFSLGVVVAVTRLCAQMAFAQASTNFRYTYGWSPSTRAVLRMVDAVGDEARAFLERAPPPKEDDGEVLIIQVDGKGAPMITEREFDRRRGPRPKQEGLTGRRARRLMRRNSTRPRRTKGKKSKNAKIAVVGVIYTLSKTQKGVEGPISKRVIATFENYEALFELLQPQAIKRGYGHKRTVFLADGAEHLWRMQQKYFPKAEVCIDWYHVVEKLWSAGECLYEEGSEDLKKWVDEQTARLRQGEATQVLLLLQEQLQKTPKQGPGNKGKRLRLSKTIDYFQMHLHRMRYAELRKDDLDIGTGAVEGAVRNLVGLRLDGPGMRWSRQRSERVLHMRCVLINDQWNAFIEHLALHKRFTLPAKPTPTQTHDAAA
jgi:hypothetical protein